MSENHRFLNRARQIDQRRSGLNFTSVPLSCNSSHLNEIARSRPALYFGDLCPNRNGSLILSMPDAAILARFEGPRVLHMAARGFFRIRGGPFAGVSSHGLSSRFLAISQRQVRCPPSTRIRPDIGATLAARSLASRARCCAATINPHGNSNFSRYSQLRVMTAGAS